MIVYIYNFESIWKKKLLILKHDTSEKLCATQCFLRDELTFFPVKVVDMKKYKDTFVKIVQIALMDTFLDLR